MKRIISMCLSAVLLLSLCVTGAAKTKTAQAEEKQKVIVIDAGHQTRAMSATEPIGPGSSQRKAKVTGGASGCVTHLPEYKLNLQVAKRLQKELVNRGYKVIMVRTKNNVRMVKLVTHLCNLSLRNYRCNIILFHIFYFGICKKSIKCILVFVKYRPILLNRHKDRNTL